MLPCNKNVRQGQAHSTQATIEEVVLKSGETPGVVLLGGVIPITAVRPSQVAHSNARVQPQIFSVEPKKYTFTANILKPRSLQMKGDEREKLNMKGIQLPLLVNNATTGYKLDGSGVDNLFVHSWSYVSNWAFVMLSRVKTQAGWPLLPPSSQQGSEQEVRCARCVKKNDGPVSTSKSGLLG